MKCYFHHDRDAVGTCRSCQRGLCPDCAVDLGKGIACKDRCEDDARCLIELVEYNVRSTPKLTSVLRSGRTTGLLPAGFLILVGVIFLGWGLAFEGTPFTLATGAVMAVYGIITLVRTLSAPRFDAGEKRT